MLKPANIRDLMSWFFSDKITKQNMQGVDKSFFNFYEGGTLCNLEPSKVNSARSWNARNYIL